VIAGVLADSLGFGGAIAAVAGLTAVSGLWAAVDLGTADARSDVVRVEPRESAVIG
jgi:hypothetical protein